MPCIFTPKHALHSGVLRAEKMKGNPSQSWAALGVCSGIGSCGCSHETVGGHQPSSVGCLFRDHYNQAWQWFQDRALPLAGFKATAEKKTLRSCCPFAVPPAVTMTRPEPLVFGCIALPWSTMGGWTPSPLAELPFQSQREETRADHCRRCSGVERKLRGRRGHVSTKGGQACEQP